VVDIIKVDIFEEEVSLDVLCVGFASTQSSCGVSSEKLHHQQLTFHWREIDLHAEVARRHLGAW